MSTFIIPLPKIAELRDHWNHSSSGGFPRIAEQALLAKGVPHRAQFFECDICGRSDQTQPRQIGARHLPEVFTVEMVKGPSATNWRKFRMSRVTRFIVTALAVVALVVAPAVGASAALWVPEKGTKWQWVLSSPLSSRAQALAVPVFDIDGFDNSAVRIASLRSQGKHAICYISAGSSESWRPDFAKFPAAVKGKSLDGWAGEKWLDIRRTDVLLPIMRARMQMCADKGFEAVEPDNVDGYANKTGFPLTAAHQLAYNRSIAAAAHSLGLSVALKNDVEQVVALEPYFDFAINEECQAYNECSVYAAFLDKGKAVLHVEYTGRLSKICSNRLEGMSTIKKKYDLDAWRQPC